MRPLEALKYLAYRTPLISNRMSPAYRYKINPGQLAALVGFVDRTRESGAAVAEIGVAQGDTSVFLLEHLLTTADKRPLLLFDTFSGFTKSSIELEVAVRGKDRRDYGVFRYGDEVRFRRRLRKAGYADFRTFKGDASKFDWSSIAPIGAVLLDVDLYGPTRDILAAIWPHLAPGGGIVVDDCVAGTPWDGSLEAYREFIEDHGLPFERVGYKGAVIRKA